MSKVIVRSNHGWFDELDGRYLTSGEHVSIRWPDGSETRECVRVDARQAEIRERWFQGKVPVHEAYVDVSIRGARVSVRLGGSSLDVERLRLVAAKPPEDGPSKLDQRIGGLIVGVKASATAPEAPAVKPPEDVDPRWQPGAVWEHRDRCTVEDASDAADPWIGFVGRWPVRASALTPENGWRFIGRAGEGR